MDKLPIGPIGVSSLLSASSPLSSSVRDAMMTESLDTAVLDAMLQLEEQKHANLLRERDRRIERSRRAEWEYFFHVLCENSLLRRQAD